MRRAALLLGLLLAACGGDVPAPSPPEPEVEVQAKAPPRPLGDLLTDLSSDDVRVRVDAADVLARGEGLTPEAVPALAKALADENRWVRDRAARALFHLGPDAAPAVPALIKALRDTDDYVRWRTARALSAVGPKAAAALAELEAMAEADAEPARTWALEAIHKIRAE